APLAALGPGSFVGELALLLGEPRSATLRVVADTWLWALRRADLDTLLTEHPVIGVELSRELGRRLVATNRQLVAPPTTRFPAGGERAGPGGRRPGRAPRRLRRGPGLGAPARTDPHRPAGRRQPGVPRAHRPLGHRSGPGPGPVQRRVEGPGPPRRPAGAAGG